MEFLMQYHLLGLVIGIATFLIIGLFHPVVVKAEYYWGTGCWWIFLLLGIGGIVWSLCTDNVLVAGAGWRIRFFIVVDDQRAFRAERARAQRLVSPQSETSGEIAAIQQDLVNCTGAIFAVREPLPKSCIYGGILIRML